MYTWAAKPNQGSVLAFSVLASKHVFSEHWNDTRRKGSTALKLLADSLINTRDEAWDKSTHGFA